jgi:phage recombination protein Bet
MATTKAKTTEKPKDQTQQQAPQQAPAAQLPAAMPLRLPYPRSMQEWAGFDQRDWQVLTDVVFPLATTANAIILAVEYCRARKLDIMKKVVHIVPMRRKIPDTNPTKYEMVDTIWPGIAEVRITATRTGIYAGKDAAIFGETKKETFKHVDDRNGETKKEEEIEFPEWCRVDVYKIVQGQRCKFEGPKVYWKEAYASESFYSDIPNEMWKSRSSGQLEKCAEAAALRAAFPEELGGEYTAEEMHGRTLDARQVAPGRYETKDSTTMTPPRPQQSDFARQPEPKPVVEGAATVKKPEPAQQTAQGPDGRPEPPVEGELVQSRQETSQPVQETPQAQPEPVREREQAPEAEDDDVPPSEAYMGAVNWLDATEAGIMDEKDLDDLKKRGRGVIDGFDGLSGDERDMLRGKFTTMVLTEQQRRGKKKR